METDPIAEWAERASERGFAIAGLGGAGSEAVHDLVRLGIPGVRTFAVNTDAQHLLKVPAQERLLIGERRLRGRGSGGDRKAALDAALDGREELVRRLSKFEIVFLLAGLGGGTGSALLPFLAQELRRTEALPIPVAFLPFDIELATNADRQSNVEDALQELEEMGGLLLALANEKLRKFDALPLRGVFQVRNAYLHALVTSLVDMIDRPSQINVDLASLKNHLAGAGLSTLLHGECHLSEPDRLVDEAWSGGLLDFSMVGPPSAVVHLEGGSNLTLRTLDRIVESVRKRLGDPRRLLLGTRIAPEPREVVRLTAVVGGIRSRSLRPRRAAPAA